MVERSGDPAAALAFAGKTHAGPLAIAALAEIIQRRLRGSTDFRYEIYPNAFGLTLTLLVDTPERARQALENIDWALGKRVDTNQLDDRLLEHLRKSHLPASDLSPGESKLAECSGELLLDASRIDLSDASRLRDTIERARTEVRSRANARFAIVGSHSLVASVEHTLSKMPSWPNVALTPAAELGQTSMGTPNATISPGTRRKLSFAWRVTSGDIANSAATSLRVRGSPLLAQLTALDEDWKVENISDVARDLGGCLRIDLAYSNDGSSISKTNLRSIVRVVRSESKRALEGSSLRAAANAIPLENDPRRAARRLAWSALSKAQDSTQNSLHVHLQELSSDPPSATLEPVLREALGGESTSPFESVSKLEAGQSELWSILASPCGTVWESASDAGSTAAWVQSTANRFTGHLGVQIEPFITPDAVGYIAHCQPGHAEESPTAMARRLGNALGSVVATGTLSGSDLAKFREKILLQIGATPRRAWWQLAEYLSSGHPASFEPLGTFDSVRNLDLASVRVRRSSWLNGPLRVGALLNRNNQQFAELNSTLHRWLDPHRQRVAACPTASANAQSSQEIQIVARSNDPRDSNVYAAVQFAPAAEQATVYEHWLLWLLARSGGWLDTALVQSGNLSSFTADIKGPRHNRALIIGMNVEDETRLSEALLRIRDLLARLAKHGAEPRELELAESWSEEQIRRAELDPRRRLLDLWRGQSVTHKTQKSGFAQYLSRALASAPVTVVRVRPKP